MKICMIGLGSIGCRHIKNIAFVLKKRKIEVTIDALRHSRKELDESIQQYVNQEYYREEELPDDYDVIFITNPTILHYDTILNMVPKTKHMFIEKPVFGEKGRSIEALNLRKDGVYYVACPMRHGDSMKYVKRMIEDGEKIISARAITSSYLPFWRKGIDYRENYSARKELGGGVALDLIHEWDYLTYLFGFPRTIQKMSGKYSDLEINTEDIAVYIADYGDKLVEVHLDYCGINAVRLLELIGIQKRVVVDLIAEEITIYTAEEKKVLKMEQEVDYINEMEYFFDIIEGKAENMNSIEYAAKLLELI